MRLSAKSMSPCGLCALIQNVLDGCWGVFWETSPGGLCSILGHSLREGFGQAEAALKGPLWRDSRCWLICLSWKNWGAQLERKDLEGAGRAVLSHTEGCPGLGLCPHTPSAGSAQRGLWPSLSLEPHLPSPRPYILLPLPQALRPRGSRVTLLAKPGPISPLSHEQHESAPLAQPKTSCSLRVCDEAWLGS